MTASAFRSRCLVTGLGQLLHVHRYRSCHHPGWDIRCERRRGTGSHFQQCENWRAFSVQIDTVCGFVSTPRNGTTGRFIYQVKNSVRYPVANDHIHAREAAAALLMMSKYTSDPAVAARLVEMAATIKDHVGELPLPTNMHSSDVDAGD